MWASVNHLLGPQITIKFMHKFAAVVHVTFTLLLYHLVHDNRGSHHWSKWSQHKSYGTSKFGTGAWAMAWASIQWLLTCITSANYVSTLSFCQFDHNASVDEVFPSKVIRFGKLDKLASYK